MKLFKCSQIQEIDAYTIKYEPIPSIDLMERAATVIMRWYVKHFSPSSTAYIFAGPGNNGGDGIALARLLTFIGYHVKLFILNSSSYSPDNIENTNRMHRQGIVEPLFLKSSSDFPPIPQNAVVIDSLFGSGLTRPLAGLASELVHHINESSAFVIAVDIPSGLFGEENSYPNNNPVIKAKITLSLQFPKLSFFFPENYDFVGHFNALDIELHKDAIAKTPTSYYLISSTMVKGLLNKRSKFSHKGTFGHCLIIAGSYGMMGASVLSVDACIRTGAGLVTAHVPKVGYKILQSQIPEALVSIDANELCFSASPSLYKYSAIGVGSGIGQDFQTIEAFKTLIKSAKNPLVIDADGINILASYKNLLDDIPKNSIITPHVGEFNRLFGETCSGFSRLCKAIKMSSNYKMIIILKGANTQVVCPDGKVFFNTTGNPAMATGGSGDVLTGIVTSLLGQGYKPIDAAVVSVFIHGLAGDIAAKKLGHNALKASDINGSIGKAFDELVI